MLIFWQKAFKSNASSKSFAYTLHLFIHSQSRCSCRTMTEQWPQAWLGFAYATSKIQTLTFRNLWQRTGEYQLQSATVEAGDVTKSQTTTSPDPGLMQWTCKRTSDYKMTSDCPRADWSDRRPGRMCSKRTPKCSKFEKDTLWVDVTGGNWEYTTNTDFISALCEYTKWY